MSIEDLDVFMLSEHNILTQDEFITEYRNLIDEIIADEATVINLGNVSIGRSDSDDKLYIEFPEERGKLLLILGTL